MAHPEFPWLYSPFRLGSLAVKNRLVALPHGTHMVRLGVPTQADLDHHVRLARGGVGLLISGGTVVHRSSVLSDRRMVEAGNPRAQRALTRRAAAVHAYGAKIIGQVFHLGRESLGREALEEAIAPSAVRTVRDAYPPRAMTIEDIEQITEAFATAAQNLERAGYDGVEIHAAHGYLIHQFLSAASNLRTDAYGGSPENRRRFLEQIAARIRAVCSPGFVVGVRLSADDEVPGGMRLDDTRRVAVRLAETQAVDYLNVTLGSRGGYVKDATHPDGPAVPAAASLREASGLPTLVGQRMRDPEHAERVVAGGSADLVGMARALFADPDLPSKAEQGRLAEVRTCLGVNQDCRAFEPHLGCTVNAELGRRAPGPLRAVPSPRTVFVVGGGPAGLEAARVGASRGHRVVVFEREEQVGGQALLASWAPHRGSMADIGDYLSRELRRLGVDLHRGAEIAVDDLPMMGEEADAVVLAVGSRAVRAADEVAAVATVDDVLRGLVGLDATRAVVIDERDGFWPAFGAAETLASRGVAVTVVTPSIAVAERIPHESIGPLFDRLDACGVRLLPHHAVLGIGEGEVSLKPMVGGDAFSISADLVVRHAGRRADDGLFLSVDPASFPAELHRVGDCVSPRRLSHAIRDGYRIGAQL